MLWARVHLHLKLMLCRKHSEHQTTYQIHKVLAENVNTKLFDNRHECQSRLRTLWNTLITFYLLSFRSCTDNRLNAKHIQWILSRSVFRCCFCFTIASSRVLPPTKKKRPKKLVPFSSNWFCLVRYVVSMCHAVCLTGIAFMYVCHVAVIVVVIVFLCVSCSLSLSVTSQLHLVTENAFSFCYYVE